MTFLELCQKTRRECGVQGSNTPTAVTSQSGLLQRIVEWVQDADLWVQRLYPDWSFLWSEHTVDTVSGSASLTQPTDLGVWDTGSFGKDRGTADGMSMTVMDFRTWRSDFYTKSNEEPSQVVIKPDNTIILPAPADGVYEIYGNYWAKPTKMTGNTDEPLYAEEFQRIIIAKAKMWFFADSEMANLYQIEEKEITEINNEYTGLLDQMRARYLPDNQQLFLNSPEEMVVRPV
jgi:hypothetical protein